MYVYACVGVVELLFICACVYAHACVCVCVCVCVFVVVFACTFLCMNM